MDKPVRCRYKPNGSPVHVLLPIAGDARGEESGFMPTHILATKLFIPPPRPRVVRRPRLIEQMNEGLHGRLTLIAAPAGFGKTTLASEWVTSSTRPAAWLSLDEGDGDPTHFLTYLVAALQTIAPTVGVAVLGALQSAQPPPIESTLTVLLNDITATAGAFILVLDDYHVVDSNVVDQALTFLLEHLPPQMHLVITTREDPQLPLVRLRARGHMTELRAADLRFTPAEAADFLNEVMGLKLAADEVVALEARTEGWVAALQLAALSMRGREDVAHFVTAFAGDNHYIVDYLVTEVLQRQPERVRKFLLETSILDRLSGPLCDAVTGQHDGTLLLDGLERSNLFVVPLDDRRHWFRYHHLFAAVLAAHAQQEQPAHVPILHQRASAWYADNGLPADAIRHALAARDFGRAADLIEPAVPAMRRSRQEATVLGWLRALPDAMVCARPVLSVYYAGTLLQTGHFEGVETRLQDAERWLNREADTGERPDAPPGMVVIDHEQFRRLPGSIAVYRAGLALVRGDVGATMHYAPRALELLPEDDDLGRGAAASLLGIAYWASGDLEVAQRMYTEGTARLLKAGHFSDVIGCAIALADILLAQGHLHGAMRAYERGLQLATEGGGPVLRGAADMHVGMSGIYHERNDLDAATQSLMECNALGEHTGLGQNPYRRRVAMARIRQAQGDLDGAITLLQEAERLYVGDFSPNVRPVAASKTRVWVAQGRLGEAFGWAREQGLSADDDLSYLREFEHITLARVLIAEYMGDRADNTIEAALKLLDRLEQAAVAGGRMGSLIEIGVLHALAYQAKGDRASALVALKRALRLAEPEGFVRIFVDEGLPMASLLSAASAQVISPDYTRRLLAFFADVGAEAQPFADKAVPPVPSFTQRLIEPLSARELEVLQLIAHGLSNHAICGRLFLALSTVKGHNHNIFGKLQVQSRTEAIVRARAIGLL